MFLVALCFSLSVELLSSASRSSFISETLSTGISSDSFLCTLYSVLSLQDTNSMNAGFPSPVLLIHHPPHGPSISLSFVLPPHCPSIPQSGGGTPARTRQLISRCFLSHSLNFRGGLYCWHSKWVLAGFAHYFLDEPLTQGSTEMEMEEKDCTSEWKEPANGFTLWVFSHRVKLKRALTHLAFFIKFFNS